MAIDVSCPSCAKHYGLPEAILGKNVKCAGCRSDFIALADAPPPGTFATRCPHCCQDFAAPERLLGRRTTCSGCQQVFVAAAVNSDPLDAAVGLAALQPTTTRSHVSAAAPSKAGTKPKRSRRSVGVGNGMHPALQVVIGIAMLIGGIVITMASFQNARDDKFTVYYGLVVMGLVTTLSGAFRWMGGRIS